MGKSYATGLLSTTYQLYMPKKWNWELFDFLYIQGLPISDIIKLPDFTGLSKTYAEVRANRSGLSKKRRLIKDSVSHIAVKDAGNQIEDLRNKYTEFALKEVEEEMGIITSRVKTLSTADQKERLDILNTFSKFAERRLGLDKIDQQDSTQGLREIYAMQQNIYIQSCPRNTTPIATEEVMQVLTDPEEEVEDTTDIENAIQEMRERGDKVTKSQANYEKAKALADIIRQQKSRDSKKAAKEKRKDGLIKKPHRRLSLPKPKIADDTVIIDNDTNQ